MAFNLELLKEHPYATGGIVIVGGIVVFYLLSRQSSGVSANPQSADFQAALAADSQLQQVAAASAVQQSQQQTALQAAQLNASVANNQTAANLNATNTAAYTGLVSSLISGELAVSENATNTNAQVTEQENTALYTQNISQMQDNVLMDQINQAAEENANNNATSLSGLQDQLNYGTGIATLQAGLQSQGLTEAATLTSQQMAQQLQLDNTIIPLAGQQKNSALDATDQTSLFQTILANGNPNVAAAGTAASASATAAGDNASANIFGSVVNGITKIGTTVASGLLA
jgi:hypothetical protein